MPYYQIEHLQALEAYMELLEVDHISKLPIGKGKPPPEDPQVFLGALTINSLPSILFPNLSTAVQISPLETDSTTSLTTLFQDLNDIFISPEALRTFIEIAPFIDMPEGINHPRFNRINDTEYTILKQDFSGNLHRAVLHVGQIAKYLDFDREPREGRKVYSKTERPFGYEEFASIFNSGVISNDKRRISTFTRTESGPFLVTKSERPVTLRNFKIRPEQCGLVTQEMTAAQNAVMTEMAISAAADNKRKQEAYEDREKKRQEKRRYFDDEPHYPQGSSFNQEEDFLPFRIDLPHISNTNPPASEPSPSITINLPAQSSTNSVVADPIPSSLSSMQSNPHHTEKISEQRKQPARKSVRNSSGGKQPQPPPQEVDELLQPPKPMEF